MATEDDLIIRVRTMGMDEATAQAGALRDEMGALGDTTARAGEKSRAGFGLFSRGIGGLAAAVGISAAVVGVKDLVNAGMNLQEQQAQLRSALAGIGETGTKAYNQVLAASLHLSEHGGFTRPEELTSITNFVSQLHNVREAEMANNAAVMLARQYHLQWGAAQMAVSRALGGNTTRLQQYVGAITSATTATANLKAQEANHLLQLKEQYKMYGGPEGSLMYQKAAIAYRQQMAQANASATTTDKSINQWKILQIIQQHAGGSIKAYNNSLAGVAGNLKNSFQILMGEVGLKLQKPIKDVLLVFKALFDFLSSHKDVLLAFASGAGLLAVVSALRLMAAGGRMVAASMRDTISSVVQFIGRLFGMTAATDEETMANRMLGVTLQNMASMGSRAAAELLTLDEAQLASTISAARMAVAQQALAESMVANVEALGLMTSRMENLGAIELAATAETEGFNAALLMNPLVAVATAAIVALTLLQGHFGQVWHGIVIGWHAIESAGSWVWKEITTGVDIAKDRIVAAWHWIEHAVKNVFHEIVKVAKWAINDTPLGTMIHLASGAAGVVSNLIHGNIGGAFHAAVGGIGGALHAATFGLLHSGGAVRPRYFDMGGPVGTDTIPGWLSPGEYVLNAAAAANIGAPMLGALNAGYGGGQQIRIQPGPVVLQLDSRTLARAVVRYSLEKAARGPSSLVGGSLVTGAGGPTSVND